MQPDISFVGFADIVKVEDQPDGSVMVTGKATGPEVDIDEQIVDPAFARKAMTDWFGDWGNIREQHTAHVAGVATSLEERTDGHYITAQVVDPSSIAKVKAKALKGFSIGIKGPRIVTDDLAKGGRIVDGEIVEVSIVDRPANPTCRIDLPKAAGLVPDVTKEDPQAGNLPNGPGHGEHDKWFRKAWVALATLISQEAQEMAQLGEDEVDCIQRLVNAAYSLRCWAIGEGAEGENVTSQLPNGERILTNATGDVIMTTLADLTKAATDARAAGKDWPEVAADLLKLAPEASEQDQKAAKKAAKLAEWDALSDADKTAIADYFMAVKAAEAPKAPTVTFTSPGLTLGAVADLVKAASAEDAPVEDRKIVQELATALGVSKLKKAQKTAQAEATKAAEDQGKLIAELSARLAKVEKAAAPGGPMRSAKTDVNDRQDMKQYHLTKALDYRRKAEIEPDSTTREGYTELAEEHEEKAAKAG